MSAESELIDRLKWGLFYSLWYKQKTATKAFLRLIERLKPQYITDELYRFYEKAKRLYIWLSMPENAALWKRERVSIPGERSTSEYFNWRLKVLERDNGTCQDCGGKKKVVVHHIKPYRDYKDLRLDVNNGIILCHNCHVEAHRCLN